MMSPALSAGFNQEKVAHLLIEFVGFFASIFKILIIENEKEVVF
jgi:hypothetical protein